MHKASSVTFHFLDKGMPRSFHQTWDVDISLSSHLQGGLDGMKGCAEITYQEEALFQRLDDLNRPSIWSDLTMREITATYHEARD